MQLGPLGGLRPLCWLAAVVALAVWPAAAAAQLDSGRPPATAESSAAAPPQVWGVEIDANAAAFLRPAYLARMRKAGVNAVVVDPTRLTAKQLATTLRAARRAKLHVIEVVPPARVRSSPS